jgi:hypothetical protein
VARSSSIDLSTPIWVKGTVVRFYRINPHTIIELDETVGAVLRRWRIEGPFLARLKRMGANERLLEAGDVIEACGFPLKDAAPDAQPLIHGATKRERSYRRGRSRRARRRDQPARAALPLNVPIAFAVIRQLARNHC